LTQNIARMENQKLFKFIKPFSIIQWKLIDQKFIKFENLKLKTRLADIIIWFEHVSGGVGDGGGALVRN
jgi:hypothetical protein